MSLPAPFGKYELLQQIGSGGMAEVFLARSFGIAGFEKRLVIKRIRPEHARDPRFVSLFINEAKIGVHLSHPNIVAVYELGKVGDGYYIAMEHLHGRDLNKVARYYRAAQHGMDPELAASIMAEVCRGLAHAHGNTTLGGDGVALVHRDISPHNIFVTFTGDVKIVDFGIARLLDGSHSEPDTGDDKPGRPGGGKYAYMSPEQALGQPVDHRTDIFSVGIVLWELLAARKLYQSSDPDEKLRKVQTAEVPHPETFGQPVDPELWRILKRALARHPDDRYATAAELEEDLRAWIYSHGARADTAAIGAKMRELFPEESERDPAALDLRRLADDIARLDHQDTTRNTTASEPTTTVPTDSALELVLKGGEEERKRVVVVVVDVDGFTSISIHAEPEVLFKRHIQFLRWLRGVVDAFGGTVHRAYDDQVYIFFGVPKTRSDDHRRALMCALELQRRAHEVAERGIHVDLAIGVHTGEITAAKSTGRFRYMARGDTTRLARRLSEQADHGQVLTSHAVYQATEAVFQFERGPWLLGRGGKSPSATYLLRGRRSADSVASKAPWLKRSDELATIQQALTSLAHGRGAVVVITGEGGSGKTRLTNELLKAAARRNLSAYVGRAGPFGRPLEIVRELLQGVLALDEQAGPEESVAHLESLRQLGLFRRDIEVLGHLIKPQSPAVDPADIWNAIRRVLQGLGSSMPIVAVFEDIQHLSAVNQDMLGRMLQHLREYQVLSLVTLQGEVPAALAESQPIALEAFSQELQARHVSHLLGATQLQGALRELVARTCEGNPLYIEELVKYLLAEKLVSVEHGVAMLTGKQDLELPENLGGLISARIDALDPASKGALQIAGIIGPTFSLRLLGEVIGIDDPFPIAQDLLTHGLISRTESSDVWTFTSEFVRSAALHGILGLQRRDYHRLVAAAIERRIGGGQDPWTEGLAEHCGRGGRPLDAARYAFAAGQRHERSKAPGRALRSYEAGLRWMSEVPNDADTYDARVQGEAMLRIRLGAVHLLVGHGPAGVRELQIALDISSEANLPWLEVRAHLQLGQYHLHSGDLFLAGAHLGQAKKMSRFEKDQELQREVLEASANHALQEGRLEESIALWNELRDQASDHAETLGRALTGLANVYLRCGQIDHAQPLLQRALDAARASDDRILEGRILNNMGLVHASRNEADQAIQYFRRAIQVREDVGYVRGVAVNHHNIGDVHFIRGDLRRAHVSFRRSKDLATEIGWQRGVAMNEVYLGYIDAMERDESTGLKRIDQAIDVARGLGDIELEISGLWLSGKLLAEQGHTTEARQRLEHARREAHERQLSHVDNLIGQTLAQLP